MLTLGSGHMNSFWGSLDISWKENLLWHFNWQITVIVTMVEYILLSSLAGSESWESTCSLCATFAGMCMTLGGFVPSSRGGGTGTQATETECSLTITTIIVPHGDAWHAGRDGTTFVCGPLRARWGAEFPDRQPRGQVRLLQHRVPLRHHFARTRRRKWLTCVFSPSSLFIYLFRLFPLPLHL